MAVRRSGRAGVSSPRGGISRQEFLRVAGLGSAGMALLGTSACSSGVASGSGEFPSEMIEVVIPYAAGGSTDVTVREMASLAEDTCGTTVISSNQTGGAGAVGFTAAATAEPDGYTVGATATELSYLHQLGITEVSPEDLRGLMRYGLNPHVYFVPEDSPYETLEDLISAAEGGANINAATSGTGSVYHLAVAGMALEAGVLDQFTNLPFDGGAAAVQAVIGGQADMTVVIFPEALTQVEAGQLRPLAVASEERIDAIPETPTLMEKGIDWASSSHLGLAVSSDTPDEKIQTLYECFREAIESEEFQQSMESQDLTLDLLPPEEFDQYLRDLSEQYGGVLEDIGLKAE